MDVGEVSKLITFNLPTPPTAPPIEARSWQAGALQAVADHQQGRAVRSVDFAH